MPLHPPAGSALTSPIYFGVRLNSSRVCTPELLRAHLQTVRQTLQCDFVVIPTASNSSLAASKASAAENSKDALRRAAEAARSSQVIRSNRFTDSQATDTSAPVTDTDVSLAEDRASATDKERISRLALERSSAVRNSPLGTQEGNGALPTAAATTPESAALVESPRFATGRAAIPVQHLAEAAVDFPTFCKDFLSPSPTKGGSVLVDGRCQCEADTAVEAPARRPGKPSFDALDGGLAAFPATYAFAPSTESDLALDSQTWNAAVVCELSPWISPDLGVLPGSRKVATVSRASRSRNSGGSGPAAGRSGVAGTRVLHPHYPEGTRSATAAAPSDCSQGSARAAPAGEQVCNCGTRRTPTGDAEAQAATQSTKETEGQDQQTHYNKRSRTTTRAGELGRLPTKDGVADEATEATGGKEQQRTDPQDEQTQSPEAPCLTESSASRTRRSADPRERPSDCSAVASAARPTAAAESRASQASPLSSDSAHPGAAVCEASAVSAAALTGKAILGSSSRRRKHFAARREEQLQLEHGLLRHWSFHERAWQREMQWATHVGAFAVITPPPAPDLIPVEYSRLLRAALDQLQPPIIWIKLPLVYSVKGTSSCSRRSTGERYQSCSSDESSARSERSSSSEGTAKEDGCGKDSSDRSGAGRNCSKGKPVRRRRHDQARRQKDPWQLWQYIRSMVGPHPSLGLCLEITPDLPDSDDELERWFAEPLRAVVLSPSLFISSGFASVGKNVSLQDPGQRPSENGRRGIRLLAAGTAPARKNAGVGESGVCLSPRHHLFLMRCAQHGVKVIFQFEEDEKHENEFGTEVPGPSLGTAAAGEARVTLERVAGAAAEGGEHRLEKSKLSTRNSVVATCEEVEQQPQIGMLAAHDFPPLSASATATPKERASPPAARTPKESSVMTATLARRCAQLKGGELVKSCAPPLEEMQPYISYVAQQLLQLPALEQTELFSAPYRDVLQSPMQPLADNLSAGNYEVFEKDPVKYLRYKEATLLRLREIWPGASSEQAQEQVKRDATHQRGETKQLQDQQHQGGQRQGRDEPAVEAAAETSSGRTPPDVETQKRRKKSRGRRRGRVGGRKSAYYWECGSDVEEEDGEEAAATSYFDTSSTAAASCASASASFPFSCSGGCPPPPPPASPCYSPGSSWSALASDWCLRGADCTLHADAGPRLVLTIVGAGRGPLVQAALEALREAGIPLCRARVFAVEKNWNAVITLRSRVRSDACVGWRAVEVVEADMREAGDFVAERADILISELLGSFGDNELSAECLDGAQMRLLKKGGVSIPSAYVSSLEPVSTHTLWQAIDSYNDPKQFECAYVVNMFAKYFPAREGPKECFHYRHPHFLLPFGDDGDSSSSSEGGNSNTDSSSRWGSESTCGDSGSDSERTKDSSRRRKRSNSREETNRSRSARNSGRREDKTSDHEGSREGEQGKNIQTETYKRHEIYTGAATPEPLHLKEAASSHAQGSGTLVDTGSAEQEYKRVPAAADIAMNCCAKQKKTVGQETRPPGGEESHGEVRGKTQHKKPSSKSLRGFTAAELTVLRHRRTRLSWRMRTDTVVHGLAGYFHCCLYKSVYISIDPRSFSEGMFSWFPLFLPFRHPVYVHRNEKLEVYVARDGDEHKVWYEWAVLQPTPTEIYNHMGKHSYIGK